ncbi:MAG: hypothetical protein LBP19_06370 [Treponema sp.]|jgi:hypothetical protein|nr:hypothetical protein [Treponema sp.]
MRIVDLCIITGLLFFWYGMIPVVGTFIHRYHRKVFRQQLMVVLHKPLLDYETWRLLERGHVNDTMFRFLGKFESVSETILWIKNESLLIPLGLRDTQIFFVNDAGLRRIVNRRLLDISEETKIFVAGEIVWQDGRQMFASTKKNPLITILYDKEDNEDLVVRIISASRNKNDYWNLVTPYSIIMGIFSLILMAIFYLQRPAFRIMAIIALIAVFIPLFPFLPPGILFTSMSRFLRKCAETASIRSDITAIQEPHERKQLRHYSAKAVLYEVSSWIILIMGIGTNIFFIGVVALYFIRLATPG